MPKAGIYPTADNRQRILAKFKQGIINQAIQSCDIELVREMNTFTWEKFRDRMKPMAEHKAGAHDDVVMEAAGGWYICEAARNRKGAARRRLEREELVIGRGGLVVERRSPTAARPWFV